MIRYRLAPYSHARRSRRLAERTIGMVYGPKRTPAQQRRFEQRDPFHHHFGELKAGAIIFAVFCVLKTLGLITLP